MDIAEILKKLTDVGIPVVIIVLLGLIKIPKLEINIWKWLANAIGKAFSSEVITKIDNVKTDVDGLRKELKDYKTKFDNYTAADMRSSAFTKRRLILEFNDDLMRGEKFSQERWTNILDIIDKYNEYCNDHPEFPNSKALLSIENIQNEYKKCQKDNIFL